MKLIYLSHNVLSTPTASNAQIMKMCQAFAYLGWEVTLFARIERSRLEDPYEYYGVKSNFEIQYFREPNSRNFWLRGVHYTFHLGRKLMLQDYPNLFYGRSMSSLVCASLTRRPYVIELHEPPRYFLEKLMASWLFHQPNFYGAVMITHALKQYYLKYFPSLNDNNTIVAPDGADPMSEYNYEPRIRGKKDTFKVGYVGSLYQGKGIMNILNIAAKLPEFEFHIIGGETRTINYWKNKIKKAENIFFYGSVSPKYAPLYACRMDVLLAPYEEECHVKTIHSKNNRDIAPWTSPLKIFEYMSTGRPMIASDLPVLREVLKQGVNSLLVNPNDLKGWVNALKKLYFDPELRQRLGMTAREELIETYSWENRAKRILQKIGPNNLSSNRKTI